MKTVKPKDIRNTGIGRLIAGLTLICVGLYFVMFSNNEELIDFFSMFIVVGVVTFMFGVYQAANYKNKVRKIIENANPDKVYDTTSIGDDISDELTSKILTEALMKNAGKILVSPKRRKMEGYLGLLFALFWIIVLIFMNLHEKQSIFKILLFAGMIVVLLIYSFYVLKTLKKYRINYFKVKYFANPQAVDNTLLTDHTDEYWETMAEQYDSDTIVSKILFALVILLIISIVVGYIRFLILF